MAQIKKLKKTPTRIKVREKLERKENHE